MRTVICLLFVLTIGACQSMPREQNSTEPEMAETSDKGLIRGTGTVVFNDFEGGFYGIVADNGRKYFAGTLAEDFRVNGLRVRFAVRLRTGVMTTVMWGQPVELVTLKRVDQ